MSVRLIQQLSKENGLQLSEEININSTPNISNKLAYFRATGGIPIVETDIHPLRSNILQSAKKYGFPSKRPSSFLAFEFEVAKELIGWEPLWTEGRPSAESLRNECWTFLTILVLPDIAIWRWPISETKGRDNAWKIRMIGGGRNTFQRIFRRILSLDRGEEHPDRWGLIRDLLEDDFSAILERTSLGSNKHIAVCIAEEFLSMRERKTALTKAAQQEIYRQATKDLRSYGVVQSLDLLPRDDLEKLIHRTFLNQESQIESKETSLKEKPKPKNEGGFIKRIFG